MDGTGIIGALRELVRQCGRAKATEEIGGHGCQSVEEAGAGFSLQYMAGQYRGAKEDPIHLRSGFGDLGARTGMPMLAYLGGAKLGAKETPGDRGEDCKKVVELACRSRLRVVEVFGGDGGGKSLQTHKDRKAMAEFRRELGRIEMA